MNLQENAENIVTKLNLVEILGAFGETHIVGSVAFGTTTKPDIDIQIYAAGHYEDMAREIINQLTSLGLTDIKERRLKKSKKYLITGKFLSNDVTWDIDVTMTQPDPRYIRDSYRFYQDYSSKMTDEKRESIIKLKKELANEKVTGDNAAFYIYLGVLDKDIKTTEEMKEYLKSL
jgi:GrpB-like predicted nucleotidyltransferase (UPF0157 family)